MEQQLEKAILITNISSPVDWGIQIESNNEKYMIPKTTQAGQPTKAYTQFQEIRPLVGDTIHVMVNEKEKEYTDKRGAQRKAINRYISYFITKRDPIPTVTPAAPAYQNTNVAPPSVPTSNTLDTPAPASLDLRLELMQGQINNLIARINDLERIKEAEIPTINVDEDYVDSLGNSEEVKVSDVPF